MLKMGQFAMWLKLRLRIIFLFPSIKRRILLLRWISGTTGCLTLDIGTHVYGEESTKSFEVNGFFSADRVTPYFKLSLHIGANHEESHYKTEEDTIFSISKSRHFQGLIVKSLGEHWSAGIYGSTNSSTYSNIKFSANISPAIEYNVFPYAESTRRQFRFLYRAGYTVFNYNEETIYDKFHENLFNESLSATFEVKEKWGTVSSTLAGSHYFPDFNKNRLSFYSSLSLHLFEGLSLRIHGNLSMVHDQLSLSKVGATEEEILLHRKQVATQYDYSSCSDSDILSDLFTVMS